MLKDLFNVLTGLLFLVLVGAGGAFIGYTEGFRSGKQAGWESRPGKTQEE